MGLTNPAAGVMATSPTTIAVGEWLAEQAQGRAIEDLRGIDAGDIRAALEIPDDRAHCAILGEDVLMQLLKRP